MINFSKEQIERTKNYWQSDYKQVLTDEDAVEILTNTYNLIRFFDEVNRKREHKTLKDE